MEEILMRNFAMGTLLATLAFAGATQLAAQDPIQDAVPADSKPVLIPDGETVYDTVNHVTWLADANLPGTILPSTTPPGTINFRFGLPLCEGTDKDPTLCIFASGAMNYTSAREWIYRLNKANHLGHGDWQLPSAPLKDPDCSGTGPAPYRESFAFGCDAGALGHLYEALGFKAPDTAVPIPPNTVGPFSNFQPNLYWSGSYGGGLACTIANFSFASGAQGGGCGGDFADVLPMIEGEVLGMPTPVGSKLHVNPGGQTVYDPETNVTWLADANLAATAHDMLGMPLCEVAPDTEPCVARDGSMDFESAEQFILNMNTYDDGKGYLGQNNWILPPVPADCPLYNCHRTDNPLGELFYIQLGKVAGEPVVDVPDIAVGPFNNLQPFPYWSCLADTIQDFCDIAAYEPAKDSEWGFSFGTGFLGTARLSADHYVTAYFQGCDLSSCQTINFPPITATEDAQSKLALSATASSGLAVSFTSTTPEVCAVSGDTASLLFPGKCTIEASQAGNDSFVSALSVQRTFTVGRAKQKINFPLILTQKQGAVVHLKATASSGLTVAFRSNAPLVISSSSIPPKIVCEVLASNTAVMYIPGTCTIYAYQDGNDLYAPASVTNSFTVKAK
jgi:hypothetical protein